MDIVRKGVRRFKGHSTKNVTDSEAGICLYQCLSNPYIYMTSNVILDETSVLLSVMFFFYFFQNLAMWWRHHRARARALLLMTCRHTWTVAKTMLSSPTSLLHHLFILTSEVRTHSLYCINVFTYNILMWHNHSILHCFLRLWISDTLHCRYHWASRHYKNALWAVCQGQGTREKALPTVARRWIVRYRYKLEIK